MKERNYLVHLMIALLSISKFNYIYTGSYIFKLETGKRNSITKTCVCNLAKINGRNFEKLMKKINESNLVKCSLVKGSLKIDIKIDTKNDNIKEEINDINDTKII